MRTSGKNVKELVEQEKKRKFDIKKEMERYHKQEKNGIKPTEARTEAKIDAVEYFNSLSKEQQKDLLKEVNLRETRDSFTKYLKYVYGDYYKMTKFHARLSMIGDKIVKDIERGKSIIVCISVPPQAGKSTTITESLPSYFLGRNPNEGVIVCSYNADFAEKFGDSNRQKLRKYGKEVFGVEISESMDTKTKFMFDGKHGQMVSTGIFGEITGNKASLIIIDDPFKSNIEAESKAYRDKVYDIVKQSCETRLRPTGSALVIIHTRWHEDDLIGRYSKEEGVVYVNIPCVWDSSFGEYDKLLGRKVGEVFCPEMGYTSEWAEKKRKSLGNRSFNALYQGKPYVDGGNIVNRDELRFYGTAELPTEFDDVTLSADLSLGGTSEQSDPTCISVWGRKGANHYLLKVINKKMGFNEQVNAMNRLVNDYPMIKKKIVEKKANGGAMLDMLGKQVNGLVPYDPKGSNKVSRLEAVTSFFEAGNIWFPNEKVMPNVEEFVEQLLKFPASAHDDFVDTLSQYLLNYEYKGQGRIVSDSTMVLLSNAIRGFKL